MVQGHLYREMMILGRQVKKCRDPLTEAEAALTIVADDFLRFPMLLEQLSPHDSLEDRIRREPLLALHSLVLESSVGSDPL